MQYQPSFLEECGFRDRFLSLLEHPRSFYRDHLPGHITGSAMIVDETGTFTLLTHHAKLDKWLQPGGHADGDENILAVSLREANEETGLKNLKLIGSSFFDIDIHVIPARKEFQEHFHYDVRFLFQASRHENFQVSEESHALAWVKLTDLPAHGGDQPSILRMAEKVRLLF